jgi:serine/threonine-protein kinase
MAAVFEGVHADLGKRVAIKALVPGNYPLPDLRARFLREGKAVARIRHPNVVDIYDVGEVDGVSYLVMEFLEGEDLSQLLARQSRLSIVHTADLMVPVIAAVDAAHRQGVVHRDLKPANIFLSETARGDVVPKVLDFGVSKLIDDGLADALTQTGTVLGTPYYMAPEQATGEISASARTDQYALGVILYQCVTGKKPFDSGSVPGVFVQIVEGKFPPPRDVNPQVPRDIEGAILRAMDKNPAWRFKNVLDFGEVLLPYASPIVRSLWGPVFAGDEDTGRIPTAVDDRPGELRGDETSKRAMLSAPGDTASMPLADPVVSKEATPPPPVEATGASPPLEAEPPPTSSKGPSYLLLAVIAASVLFMATVVFVVLILDRPAPKVVAPEPAVTLQPVEPEPAPPPPEVAPEPEATPPESAPAPREPEQKESAPPPAPARKPPPSKKPKVLRGTHGVPILQ